MTFFKLQNELELNLGYNPYKAFKNKDSEVIPYNLTFTYAEIHPTLVYNVLLTIRKSNISEFINFYSGDTNHLYSDVYLSAVIGHIIGRTAKAKGVFHVTSTAYIEYENGKDLLDAFDELSNKMEYNYFHCYKRLSNSHTILYSKMDDQYLLNAFFERMYQYMVGQPYSYNDFEVFNMDKIREISPEVDGILTYLEE